jgi:hypothetical protein
MGWKSFLRVEVIVSYVELKKGVGDAFSGKAYARETKKAAALSGGCRLVGFVKRLVAGA